MTNPMMAFILVGCMSLSSIAHAEDQASCMSMTEALRIIVEDSRTPYPEKILEVKPEMINIFVEAYKKYDPDKKEFTADTIYLVVGEDKKTHGIADKSVLVYLDLDCVQGIMIVPTPNDLPGYGEQL